VRIAALILGLAAGLFTLFSPAVLRTDLMAPMVERWAASGDGQLLGLIAWYAAPVAALVGGVLAAATPGFAALLLLAAAGGWLVMSLLTPDMLDFWLLIPALTSCIAGILAFVAGEMAIREQRERRRTRLQQPDDSEPLHRVDDEREAAFRLDPLLAPRPEPQRAPQQPQAEATPTRQARQPARGNIPLTLDPDAAGRRTTQAMPLPEETPAGPARSPGAVPFRWENDDQPANTPRPPTGPRLEPRQPSVRAARTAAPASVAEPRTPDEWRERRPAYSSRPVRAERGISASAIALVSVLLVLAVVGTGGYLAYREGMLDELIASVQAAGNDATASGTDAQQTASVPSPAVEIPPAALVVPPAVVTPPAAVTPPAVATTASLPEPLRAPSLNADATYDDPVAYCAAVGTIDQPDYRYRGPAFTQAITAALSLTEGAAADRIRWRCSAGKVMACASYIGPICDTAPSVAEMVAYCRVHPAAPLLLAPHGTWSCAEGRPQLPEGVNWPVDDRGFLPRAWVTVNPAPQDPPA